MVQIKDFEFSITQRGMAIKEHKDITSTVTENECTQYAEILEDENFQLRVVCSSAFRFGIYTALLVEVAIDGKAVNGKCFPRNDFVLGKANALNIRGAQKAAGRNTLHELFRFEESETRLLRPDESLDRAREAFKDQGTIKITVSRAVGSFTQNTVDVIDSAQVRYPRDIVKEKGSTTCITYDHRERNEDFDTFELSLAEAPIATVIYKYRTLEILRDLHVVGSNPIQKGIGETIVVPDDDELVSQNAELKARIAVLENEHARSSINDELEDEIEVVEERSAAHRFPGAEDEVEEVED